MSAAKTRNAKKTKASKVRRSKPKISEPKLAAKAAAAVRQFRFNAAQTVRIRFAGEKKPENFRVDDMVEASMVTLAGAVKHYYQYRLISNDKAGPGGASLMQALFTSTSAVCVTGLTVVDTGTYWSGFGQAVILGLIQIGGFGIMTLASLLGLLIARRMGLRARLSAPPILSIASMRRHRSTQRSSEKPYLQSPG